MKHDKANEVCSECGGKGIVIDAPALCVNGRPVAVLPWLTIDNKRSNAKVIMCVACTGRSDVVEEIR